MNFFEGLGIFTVALVAFFMSSFLIGVIFITDHTERLYLAAWISGAVVYALTVVGMVYISRYGGSL